MKADLYVIGVYRGQVEVGENSLVGRLARLDFGGAMKRVSDMCDEMQELGREVTVAVKGEGDGPDAHS